MLDITSRRRLERSLQTAGGASGKRGNHYQLCSTGSATHREFVGVRQGTRDYLARRLVESIDKFRNFVDSQLLSELRPRDRREEIFDRSIKVGSVANDAANGK